MKTSKVKVLFLDIGGVLLTNGWGHESRLKAAQTFGFDYTEMETLHHFIFNIYEINNITLNEYLDTVVFNHSRDFTKEDSSKTRRNLSFCHCRKISSSGISVA